MVGCSGSLKTSAQAARELDIGGSVRAYFAGVSCAVCVPAYPCPRRRLGIMLYARSLPLLCDPIAPPKTRQRAPIASLASSDDPGTSRAHPACS